MNISEQTARQNVIVNDRLFPPIPSELGISSSISTFRFPEINSANFFDRVSIWFCRIRTFLVSASLNMPPLAFYTRRETFEVAKFSLKFNSDWHVLTEIRKDPKQTDRLSDIRL